MFNKLLKVFAFFFFNFFNFLRVFREEGISGFRLRIADYLEYRRARKIPEERTPEEALLAELSRPKNEKHKNQVYQEKIETNHFLCRPGVYLHFPQVEQPVISILLAPKVGVI
jgi:hypothetical protein